MKKILLPIAFITPPFLVIFGYGGMVCYSNNGSLQRIQKSFNNK